MTKTKTKEQKEQLIQQCRETVKCIREISEALDSLFVCAFEIEEQLVTIRKKLLIGLGTDALEIQASEDGPGEAASTV
jgi:hypothetical protein